MTSKYLFNVVSISDYSSTRETDAVNDEIPTREGKYLSDQVIISW